MHWGFSGSFPGSTIFICKFKTDQCFFFLETFLVSKLETLEKCKEEKHIMITIIAIVYIFYLMWYFMSSWKLLAENTQASSDKIRCPIFTHCPHKIQKVQVPPFYQHRKISRCPCRKGSEDTRVHRSLFCQITLELLYFWDVYDVNLLE